MAEISKYDKFVKSCESYKEYIKNVTIDECFCILSGIPINCNHEEIIIRAIGQKLLKLEKIEHELYLINNAEYEVQNNAYTFVERVEQIVKEVE